MAAVRSLHACGSRLKTLGASLPNHLGSQRGERYRRREQRERDKQTYRWTERQREWWGGKERHEGHYQRGGDGRKETRREGVRARAGRDETWREGEERRRGQERNGEGRSGRQGGKEKEIDVCGWKEAWS